MTEVSAFSAVERFSTPFCSAKANLQLWNEVAGISSAGLTVDSVGSDFKGELYRWRLGDMTLLWPRATESVVRRHAGTGSEERLFVHLQGQGECLQQQGVSQCRLRPGDLSLCTSDLPSELRTTTHDMLVIDLPRRHIADRLGPLDGYLARAFDSRSPSVAAFRQFLICTWRDGMAGGAFHDELWSRELHQCIVNMLVLALRGTGAGQAPCSGLDQIAHLVATRLHDPALCGRAIAEELGVSVRTVQSWLTAIGQTPTGYIQQRRMEEARRRLLHFPHEPISTIAYDCGFKDQAYFSRCFRSRFGMTPRRWRESRGVAISAH